MVLNYIKPKRRLIIPSNTNMIFEEGSVLKSVASGSNSYRLLSLKGKNGSLLRT